MPTWIATHYPHTESGSNWFIYLKNEWLAEEMPKIADCVLFYGTGQAEPGTVAAGTKGIVCEAVVVGPLEPRDPLWGPWKYQMRCRVVREGFVIPLNKIREVVKGPFYRHSFWSLDAGEYERIIEKENRGLASPLFGGRNFKIGHYQKNSPVRNLPSIAT